VSIRNVVVGRKGLTQTVLSEAFEGASARRSRSVIATGNIVVTLGDIEPEAYLEQLRARLLEATGLNEPLFLRSAQHLNALATKSPFDDEPKDDVYERTVTFTLEPMHEALELPIRSKRDDLGIFAATTNGVFAAMRQRQRAARDSAWHTLHDP
jgi:uncharacterized protein (DUF1697 family)